MAYYKCGKIFATQNSNTSIETASGAIANFNTSLAMPVLGCKVAFSASQATGTPTPSAPIPIVGVDKVTFARTGKNLCPNKTYERNAQNVRLGVDTLDGRLKYKAGTYTISLICPLSTSLYYSSNGVNTNINATTSGTKRVATFTLLEDTELFFYAYNSGGLTSADISELQLETGSTATDYEAYNGVTATINLGGTYYGGAVDAVTGKISVSKDVITFSGSESWSYHSSGFFYTTTQITNYKTNNAVIASNGIKIRLVIGGTYAVIRVYVSDNTDYIDSSTNMQTIMTNGIQAPYELDTPETEYASNSAEIPTLNGLNQVYADSGDVEVKYRRLHNDL